MAALIHTPSRKRGYGLYDDNIGLASDCKRIRNSTELSAALARLHALFPAMDDATVSKVLDACEHNIDAAIEQLSSMQIAQGGVAPVPKQYQQQQLQQQQQLEAAASEMLPSTPDEWVMAFVTEMSKSQSVDDARKRASRALEAFEAFVMQRQRRLAAADEENKQRIERENAVLKRAVAIQAQRLGEARDSAARVAGEVQRLVKQNEEYADKLKQAQLTNYSLSVHLRQAYDGGNGSNFESNGFHHHPDVC